MELLVTFYRDNDLAKKGAKEVMMSRQNIS